MSAQGLSVIDHTVQLTHEWINELTDRVDWTHQHDAMRLMRVTMQRIRDHLPVDESAQFAAQLPLLIRGMYYEGWVPKKTPIKERHAVDFFAAIEGRLGDIVEYRGHEDIQAVLKLLNTHISRGEIEDIRAVLPEDIRAYWPAP